MGDLVFEAIKYLIDEFEFTNDQLLAFNLDWSKTRLFSKVKKVKGVYRYLEKYKKHLLNKR